jgi:Tfp pilus assembly protein PilF
MDCRTPLVLALGLGVGVAGCQHPVGGLQVGARTPPGGNQGEPLIRKPETYVAFGDFRAQSGFAPEATPEQQRQYREDARRSYLQALALDPKCRPAYVALGRFYQAVGDSASAVTNYRKALELSDKDAEAWFNLGLCQCRQKDWNGGAESLARAVTLEPESKRYVNTLGFTLARAGHFEESLACLTRTNGEAGAHLQLAKLLRHMNQPEQARQQVALALYKDPSLTAARALLSEMDGHGPAAVQTVSHTEMKPAQSGPLPRGAPPPDVRTGAAAVAPDTPGRPVPIPPLPVLNSPAQK